MDQATSVVRQAVLDIAGMAIKGRPLRETTPGDILVIESIFASLMNSLNPLRAPEFVDVQANGYERDNARYVELALEAVREVQGYCESAGIYGYAPGPNFETPVEKIVFRLVADVVGMSAAHEVMILTKLNIPFAHIALITNGPFVTHSHEDNGAVGKSSADKCGQILQVLVDKMARVGKEEEFERSLPHSATL